MHHNDIHRAHQLIFITGKTSLADSLVASNGIISQRQAGKVTFDFTTRGRGRGKVLIYQAVIAVIFFSSFATWTVEKMNS